MNQEVRTEPATEKKGTEETDEINLIDLCLVLWKRKLFILLATVLPTLCLAGALLLGPQKYQATYVFDANDWQLSEMHFNLLHRRFYSEGNLTKIANKSLQGNAPHKDPSMTSMSLEKLISLTAEPDFIDLSKLKTAAPDQLIKIREVNAQLLNLTVAGNSIEGVSLLGTATRDNIAHVMPMYTIQDELNASVRQYKAMLADFVF